MAFLVRKLNKRNKLCALSGVDIQNTGKILADIPTCEFRTTNGALSTWIVDSVDQIGDAVLAIAVSSSNLSKMDFILIDTELLPKYGLTYQKTHAGQVIPIKDLQDLHCDIENISIEDLVSCTKIYSVIFNGEPEAEEKYILRYAEGDIKGLLESAIKDNRVDPTHANGNIKCEIEKIMKALSTDIPQ